MDTQQLKVFAERLRAYLERHNLTLKHGQTLDLIAAIPGLRNWPEVNAFPARVSAAQWDSHSADRLVKRIGKLHALILPVDELHRALDPMSANVLKVWPDGPVPGVYVTTSQEAIDAAIAKYEAATDGALLYAEDAGRSSDAAIDLGEHGLFSRGMDRLPSGTLVVVGPVPLTQESWSDNKDRLNTAANLAHSSSLRVVVLAETPLPENLHSDIDLLLRPDDEGLDSEPVDVLGIVTESGDLQVVQPFVQRRAAPAAQHFTTTQRLPQVLEDALRLAVTKRPYGIIVLGITPGDTQRKALVEAVLPLTEHAGPAVRIQPTFRPGYGKDDTPLSPHFEGLPVFPSIESAYAHGYRRMVIESSHHGAGEAIARHAHEVCFLIRSFSTEVAGAWMSSLPAQIDKPNALDVVTAVLCAADVPAKAETVTICDAFVGGASPAPTDDDIDRLAEHMEAHRAVRWQEQLDALLVARKVTPAQVKKALRRHNVDDYLASRKAAQV
ncbi:hypothetical protein ACIRTQ_09735 [Pseudomonas aeruginosa]|jgi:hypothetical protein|uniref:Uncharacterized protein n=4 Tax=Pseudomonas TaxID=286 RepID=A0A1L7NKX3_PSEPU|nr:MULTISPECIES: hypothetical protein [Pseudomonadota]ARS49423.1 hypothetical protein PSMEN_13930 [Pseudomonas mendocina]AXL71402.1 hypothetical protein Y31_3453 [Pseudomonas aeruginosa]ELQ3333177.1 hypothetical protein [Pseudomonas aeruginosa]ELQ7356366.1 hypothetical protein [Pseudomonas aeruginosa]KGE69054.1 hypothetical protein K814_0104940 [Pseudomonas fluorescens LMG 5329]